jgi:hypothetical protein
MDATLGSSELRRGTECARSLTTYLAGPVRALHNILALHDGR